MNFNDLTVIFSHLNPFSTLGNGFLYIWLVKYYRKSDKTLNKKYYQFILLFMIMFLIQIIKLLTIDLYSDRLSIYLECLAPLMGGPPKYWDFIFSCIYSLYSNPRRNVLITKNYYAINGLKVCWILLRFSYGNSWNDELNF
jgi:hypothetical protein